MFQIIDKEEKQLAKSDIKKAHIENQRLISYEYQFKNP